MYKNCFIKINLLTHLDDRKNKHYFHIHNHLPHRAYLPYRLENDIENMKKWNSHLGLYGSPHNCSTRLRVFHYI